MPAIHLVLLQQSSAPRANQVGPTNEELRQQIQQSIRDAQQAAREAAQQAREAAQQARDARPTTPHIVIDRPPPMTGHTGTAVGDFDNSDLIPRGAVDIAQGFFFMCAVIVVGWPLARAFGRRIERKGEAAAALPPAVGDQLQRIEQAVDAMAIEIERISESQRFMAKLQNAAGQERMALPHERG